MVTQPVYNSQNKLNFHLSTLIQQQLNRFSAVCNLFSTVYKIYNNNMIKIYEREVENPV